MGSIEIFVIFTVRALYLAIVPRSKRFNELVLDAEFFQPLIKQMRHRRLFGNESLCKFSAIVGLNTGQAEKRILHPLGSSALKGMPAPPPVRSPTMLTCGSPFINITKELAAL